MDGEDFLDASTTRCAGDVDDQVDRLADQPVRNVDRNLADQIFQTVQRVAPALFACSVPRPPL